MKNSISLLEIVKTFFALPPQTLAMAVLGLTIGLAMPFMTVRKPWNGPFTVEDAIQRSPGIKGRIYGFDNDQRMWVDICRDFPESIVKDKTFRSRPVYPLLVSGLCRLVGLTEIHRLGGEVLSPPFSGRRAYLCGLVVNVAVFILAVCGFYAFLLSWRVEKDVAALGAGMFAMSPVVLWTVSDVGTYFIASGITVAALWVFTLILRDEKDERLWLRAGLLGCVLGCLTLAKPQYDILLLGWLVLRTKRGKAAMWGSFVGHALPVVVWMVVLRLFGLKYYNHEMIRFKQGIWLIWEYPFWPFARQVTYPFEHAHQWVLAVWKAVSLCAVLAAAQAVVFVKRRENPWVLFTVAAMVVNLAFTFALRKPAPYLAAGIGVGIVPLAAFALCGFWRKVAPRYSGVLMFVFAIILMLGCCMFYKPSHLIWTF